MYQKFLGSTENAIKSQIWKTFSVYMLLAINKKVYTKTNLGYIPRIFRPNKYRYNTLETSALETIQTAEIVKIVWEKFGVSCALDDFGTSYSSLAYLKRLPARTLKIDQSFVRDMLEDMEDQAIVEGVVNLAKVFNRQVIAEGVESTEHGIKLLELGCEIAQGYGIACPMPAENVLFWEQENIAKKSELRQITEI